MMHEREKSDPAVVAVKPVNNAERSAAEPVEPRAGAKGNAEQHSTCRAQYRVSVSQALERIRQVRRHSPEVGAVCGKAARTDLCGGALSNGRPYRDRYARNHGDRSAKLLRVLRPYTRPILVRRMLRRQPRAARAEQLLAQCPLRVGVLV